MYNYLKFSGAALAAVLLFSGTSPAQAYGPEGLFGGRPKPDSSILVTNPVDLKNDRPERAESVLDHPRPDYDPTPIEVGSFELFPSLEFGETYEDNIYATDGDVRNDASGVIRPVVNLFSDWGRHALSVTAFGDFAYYSQHPEENYQSLVGDVNGRYDIANQIWVGGHAGHQYLAESRISPDNVNGEEPVTFNLTKGGLSFYHGVGKLALTVDYDYQHFVYENTPTTASAIDQSNRSRDEHLGSVILSYNEQGNISPYIRGSYNIRDYHHYQEHDGEGYDAVIGTTVDMGGMTSLDVYAGWMVQDYDDFFGYDEHQSSPKFGARVDWNPTGLTSVVFETTRSIEETNLDDYHSYYMTGGSATITHELLRNVLIEGDFAFSRLSFNGNGSREDDIVMVAAGGRYLISRNLYTELMYSWDRRYSNADDSDYIRNMVLLRFGVRL